MRAATEALGELDRRRRTHANLSASGFEALAVLDGADGPLTGTEIATHLLVTTASITSLLDTLARRGYVERRPHPHDRRKTLISLTDAGRELVDAMLPTVHTAATQFLDPPPPPFLTRVPPHASRSVDGRTVQDRQDLLSSRPVRQYAPGMADVTILHNSACSSSRHALAQAEESENAPEIVHYLETPLDRAALLDLIGKLEDQLADLVRKDPYFAQLGLDANDYVTPEAVADLLVEHPRLMQRPVLIKGDRAIIGRPHERVGLFLDS